MCIRDRAGRCLVFSAERDGMELVGVVLNCGEWFDAAQRMLDWGFDTFKPVEVMHCLLYTSRCV